MEIFIPSIRKNKSAMRSVRVKLVDHDTNKLSVMTIAERKNTTRYTVEEIYADAGFDGRAFRLEKIESNDGYNVLICRNVRGHLCDCAGFEYGNGKPCKHIGAIGSLIEQGKLIAPCSDREPEKWPADETTCPECGSEMIEWEPGDSACLDCTAIGLTDLAA